MASEKKRQIQTDRMNTIHANQSNQSNNQLGITT